VKPRRPTHETRSARQRREFWKRFGVWVFIVFFALGSAGLVVISALINR
jgi:hypothetical protein